MNSTELKHHGAKMEADRLQTRHVQIIGVFEMHANVERY